MPSAAAVMPGIMATDLPAGVPFVFITPCAMPLRSIRVKRSAVRWCLIGGEKTKGVAGPHRRRRWCGMIQIAFIVRTGTSTVATTAEGMWLYRVRCLPIWARARPDRISKGPTSPLDGLAPR